MNGSAEKLPPRPGSAPDVKRPLTAEELKAAPFAIKLDGGVVFVSRAKAVEILANLSAQLAMREHGNTGI